MERKARSVEVASLGSPGIRNSENLDIFYYAISLDSEFRGKWDRMKSILVVLFHIGINFVLTRADLHKYLTLRVE